jgi:hypothetical protein
MMWCILLNINRKLSCRCWNGTQGNSILWPQKEKSHRTNGIIFSRSRDPRSRYCCDCSPIRLHPFPMRPLVSLSRRCLPFAGVPASSRMVPMCLAISHLSTTKNHNPCFVVEKPEGAISVKLVPPTWHIDHDAKSVTVSKSGGMFLEFAPCMGPENYDWNRHLNFFLGAQDCGTVLYKHNLKEPGEIVHTIVPHDNSHAITKVSCVARSSRCR